jgi:hypothetical protein
MIHLKYVQIVSVKIPQSGVEAQMDRKNYATLVD